MVSDRVLRVGVAVAALAVPVSYVIGFARADADALWGGIRGAGRLSIMPFMLAAAAGFLAFVGVTLFRWGPEARRALHWPWMQADGNGQTRLAWAYGLYLIPSALWLEATILHLRYDAWWTQGATILVLGLVSVGAAMFILLAWQAVRDHVPQGRWLLGAALAMGIQSILNDLVIWVAVFPW